MDICLWVLKESNKSRLDSYSVRNSVLNISHTTSRDCRVHIFSDNLSRNSCIHSYTHLVTSSALNEWSVTFKTTATQNVTDNTRNAKEYRIMTAQCMSQNLPKLSLRDFLSLRHPNHFVLAGANNRNVIIPTDSSRPLFKQIEIFLDIDCMTLYFKITFLNIRASY